MSGVPSAPVVSTSAGAKGLQALAPALRQVRWPDKLPAASVALREELHNLFLTRHDAPSPPVVAALLGGSQAPPSGRHIKPFVRQVGAASTRQGAPSGRSAPKADLAFSSKDHPSNSVYSGALPMLCTPTIC